MNEASAIVLFSGGQDSTTCLFWAKKQFKSIIALSFKYGQKHAVELDCAANIAKQHNIEHYVLDISFLGQMSQSSLVNSTVDINQTLLKDNEETKQYPPATFIPGRNALFLNLAMCFAAPKGISHYVIGACEVDFSGYPDCRHSFISAQEKAMSQALDSTLKIHTPLMYLDKAQTFALAQDFDCLNTVIEQSHTCYKGNRDQLHSWGYGCDACDACHLRKKGFEAFQKNTL